MALNSLQSWWTTPIIPHAHLFEICDQSWCPSIFRTYVQSNVARGWTLPLPGQKGGSMGSKAGELLIEHLPSIESYNFVDPCAGGGGPVPAIEASINARLRKQGLSPVRFILTDLYPYVQEWRRLQKANENISFIEEPIDATNAERVTPTRQKECRIISGSFHHFDNDAAARLLKNTVQNADAFAIFEFQSRDIPSFINMTFGFFASFLTTLLFFWDSPVVLLFTYLIPIIPPAFAWEGYVSSIRGRQPKEIHDLMVRQPDLDLRDWVFQGGIKSVLPPVGNLYWFMGHRKLSRNANLTGQ